MNVNSAVEEPAMLCASILSWYTDAGVRPGMVNLLCGFKALDTVTKGNCKDTPKYYKKLTSNYTGTKVYLLGIPRVQC
jgi:hypothetical protein